MPSRMKDMRCRLRGEALSTRELEVLRWLTCWLTDEAIAGELGISHCQGSVFHTTTKTNIGPTNNPAGYVEGTTNACTAGMYVQGYASKHHWNASVQTCDYGT